MRARHVGLVAALFAAILFVGCSKGSGDSPEELAAAAKAAGTVNGLCPIREQPVNPGNSVDHNGQKIGFCCGPCKKTFLADPEKYMNAMKADPKKYAYKP